MGDRHATEMGSQMRVFIIGISGAVGRLLARDLVQRGDEVSGLVRRQSPRPDLASEGVRTVLADLAEMSTDDLTATISGVDAVVYTAGSNGGARNVTVAIDSEGVVKTLEACSLIGIPRFFLISVLPEAGRGQDLSADEEFYFAVKKLVDVTVSMSDLDWLILRPSLLVDRKGIGTISLGPAQPHDEISREDVAATIAELLHEPRIRRQILELNQGSTPITHAVQANIR